MLLIDWPGFLEKHGKETAAMKAHRERWLDGDDRFGAESWKAAPPTVYPHHPYFWKDALEERDWDWLLMEYGELLGDLMDFQGKKSWLYGTGVEGMVRYQADLALQLSVCVEQEEELRLTRERLR